MVELVNQRKRIITTRGQREREHRVATCRRGQRVANHRIGHSNTGRGQRRKPRCGGQKRVAQRRIRTTVEQGRNRSSGGGRCPGNVSGATSNTAGHTIFVNRSGQQYERSGRGIINDIYDQCSRCVVAVFIGDHNGKVVKGRIA